jgi:hypothetical protein
MSPHLAACESRRGPTTSLYTKRRASCSTRHTARNTVMNKRTQTQKGLSHSPAWAVHEVRARVNDGMAHVSCAPSADTCPDNLPRRVLELNIQDPCSKRGEGEKRRIAQLLNTPTPLTPPAPPHSPTNGPVTLMDDTCKNKFSTRLDKLSVKCTECDHASERAEVVTDDLGAHKVLQDATQRYDASTNGVPSTEQMTLQHLCDHVVKHGLHTRLRKL